MRTPELASGVLETSTMTSLRCLAVATVALSSAPAWADGAAVTQAEQLIVVTPNAPVIITQQGTQQGGPAAAGPSTVAPARDLDDAPQTTRWSDVSHINGTLVKVGEKSEYLTRYRKTNIASNPIGWMIGIYGLSVSHAVHANVAVRADANIISIGNTDGYEVGVTAPIYFKRVYQGPFLEPGLIVRGERNNYEAYGACDPNYACGGSGDYSSSTMVGPQVLFGWHRTFDSGLNVAAAAGVARNLSREAMSYSGEPDIQPVGYFRVGYAF